MRHLAFPAIVCLAAFCQRLPADSSESSSNLGVLIEQLGSKDFHVRDAASKQIAAFGIDVLPALQKARSHPDPEVRRRIEELIPPLERTIALMPKRINLHLRNKTVREVLSELSRQTGYKLGTWPDGGAANGEKEKTVYNFDFNNSTFWEALDRLCESAGLVLQQTYGEEKLSLYYQDSYVPFVDYNGPFRMVASGFNYNRSNHFGQLPRNPSSPILQNYESLQINLMVAVEPKLPILRLGLVKLTAAEDDEGRSMLPVVKTESSEWSGMRSYYSGYYRNYIQSAQANLIWPAKSSRTLKSLRGLIPITLLADQKATIVTDKILAAKGKTFKAGSATFRIEDVTPAPGNQQQIKISVTEGTSEGASDYSRVQSLQQRLEIQDQKGIKTNFYFTSVNWPGPSHAQFTITVQPSAPMAGPAAKLVYYDWVVMEHELAFEFKNLPLP